MPDWNERFKNSLAGFDSEWQAKFGTLYEGDAFPKPFLSGSLDSHARESAKYVLDDPLLAESFIAAIMHRKIFLTSISLKDYLATCESPIEVAMATALWVVGEHLVGQVEIQSNIFPAKVPEHEVLAIQPQAEIGQYRVDFLLHYRILRPVVEDGKIIKDAEPYKRMVVECDGHDYHEKTKQQARRDKERDRLMQSMGISVFRFAGSELWEDVFGCATQAIVALTQAAERAAKE